MILKMDFTLKNELDLPINYQHILQSALYALVKNADLGDKNYHDEGAYYEKRAFRLFVFGRLQGKCRVENGRIYFREKISLEVRSVFPEMLEKMCDGLEENGLYIGRRYLKPSRLFLSDVSVKKEKICIEMDSSVVAYRTMEDKKTVFFSPWQEEFYSLIIDNFKHKYEAYCGKVVRDEELPKITLVEAGEKDKVVTRYKNFYITGWKGRYMLRGKAEYLDFLYQTGIGSKNSQGFGLFHIAEEE